MCVESILKNIEKQNEDLSSYHTKIKTLGINYFGLFYLEIYVFDSDDNLKQTNNVCVCMCVLVTQLCLTLCNPTVCPWNSTGKNSGVGCHSLLHIYIYIYMYTYTHTYIYTYIYTPTYMYNSLSNCIYITWSIYSLLFFTEHPWAF